MSTPMRQRLSGAVRRLTTPLLPEDYLALINPLWSGADPRGRIEAVRHEAPGVASLLIRPGTAWTGHRPGQWLKIGVDLDGVRHWRTFSLSSPPRSDGRLTITVKAGGRVSRHLVHAITPGTIIRIAPADGDFVLPDRVPDRILFLTAGSGITPVMAMLRHLDGTMPGALPGVMLIHSARTPDEVIFGAELRELARVSGLRLYERHTADEGRLKPAELDDLCPDWAERETWACGPAGMLEEISAHWAEAARPLHIERFQPDLKGTGDAEGGRVTFTVSGVETDAAGGTPLLEAGESAGALLPSGCRMGICYSCVGRLHAGQVRDLRTGEVHGEEGHLIQTCVSAAAGPVRIEL
ncbi:ferredoxin reductase [Actinomadura sp. 9N407]|uniref:ferredoxin reductase n=1 Tax=Actinomadura sp. 9N407 TaxID=3375154 RepID=UPI0037A581F7